ncbi:Asp-tRNA(Asn)/Glu-tRNA(Gln) amidotransferase subunit GatB [candidate division KSB1 bacterium]|nr:Asp-tRNA(Asn)/Glu-tRNA(Gln) amidotransferase subunit GatB [candidate division KSB1 bacterium]
MDYEVIICFETHVELHTATKLFCDCAVEYGAPPNSNICPVCTGQPGALPVLNKKAVEYCIRAGLALNCEINRNSRFARKNYFYPDLPKGYQISQYELPFCENGFLEISNGNGGFYPVGIKRIHLEEDAGKLVHSAESLEKAEHSLVDYNRACVPLLEIVGDHLRNPLRSIEQARMYLEKLRQTLRYIEISECIIEKGQFRCDVNISLRPKGSKNFGNRTEIKNMASFRFITEALEYEIKRQTEILDSGGEVLQETRLFDEQKKITLPMRSKENAPDYRYFPDPDLIEVELESEFIEKIRATLPELPDQKLKRFIDEYGIPRNDAIILTRDKNVADYFIEGSKFASDQKKYLRWILKELFKLLNEANVSINDCKIPPRDFAELINFITKNQITEPVGRDVLSEMFQTGRQPGLIIKEKGLQIIQDDSAIQKIIDEIFAKNPEPVALVQAGQLKTLEFLIGQVMRETKGKASPNKVREMMMQKLSKY